MPVVTVGEEDEEEYSTNQSKRMRESTVMWKESIDSTQASEPRKTNYIRMLSTLRKTKCYNFNVNMRNSVMQQSKLQFQANKKER